MSKLEIGENLVLKCINCGHIWEESYFFNPNDPSNCPKCNFYDYEIINDEI